MSKIVNGHGSRGRVVLKDDGEFAFQQMDPQTGEPLEPEPELGGHYDYYDDLIDDDAE